MTPDEYLDAILEREQVDTSPQSPVRGVLARLNPVLSAWGGNCIRSINPSGSFAKRTANLSGTDIDFFVSLRPDVRQNLKEIYETLFDALDAGGLHPRRQNVSIGVMVDGYSVDLVPAKQQSPLSEYHSLYRSKADTWTQTNVAIHIEQVSLSNRVREIRILKLWRDQYQLEFPSFYLELVTIKALQNARHLLSENVLTVLSYLRDDFVGARFVDPANTNNIISDDLSSTEKEMIALAADAAVNQPFWGDIVR